MGTKLRFVSGYCFPYELLVSLSCGEPSGTFNMNEKLPRYGVQSVGGGWDLFVVFDRTKGHYASTHSTENWVARFHDNTEGYEAAQKKAKELNASEDSQIV